MNSGMERQHETFSFPSAGYIPQIVALLNKLDNIGSLQACMGVLVPLSGTVTCIESLGTVNTIAGFKRATLMCTDIISPMAEALHRMMEKTNLTQPPGAILAQVLGLSLPEFSLYSHVHPR